MPSFSKTNRWNRLRYTLYAPIYDLLLRGFTRGARRRSIESLALQAGERVLVVGCGTGLDFPFFSKDVHVVAGDLTPAMVHRARRMADEVSLDADVREMDAHRLDLPDGAFDAVVLHFILAVVPDPHAAIREVRRVLKPDGRVTILDKFLRDDARPSLLRRTLNVVTDVVATDLNLQLGPLLNEAGLRAETDEPVALGGLFRRVLARPQSTT